MFKQPVFLAVFVELGYIVPNDFQQKVRCRNKALRPARLRVPNKIFSLYAGIGMLDIKALLFKIHVRQGEGQQFAFPDAGPIQDIERGVLTSSAYCAAFP